MARDSRENRPIQARKEIAFTFGSRMRDDIDIDLLPRAYGFIVSRHTSIAAGLCWTQSPPSFFCPPILILVFILMGRFGILNACMELCILNVLLHYTRSYQRVILSCDSQSNYLGENRTWAI